MAGQLHAARTDGAAGGLELRSGLRPDRVSVRRWRTGCPDRMYRVSTVGAEPAGRIRESGDQSFFVGQQ